MPIRVIVADDHALFRDGLKSLFSQQADIAIVGETERIEGLLALIDETPADILLLDLQMERSSLADIGALAARVAVVVVTASELIGDATGAMRMGARAVIFKRFAAESLLDAVRTVAAGGVWMPPSLQVELADRLQKATRSPLSAREEEVVRHVALGLQNAAVGKVLFISEQTVKSHLNNVFAKLGVKDRVGLTLYAIRNGIIGLHERD